MNFGYRVNLGKNWELLVPEHSHRKRKQEFDFFRNSVSIF